MIVVQSIHIRLPPAIEGTMALSAPLSASGVGHQQLQARQHQRKRFSHTSISLPARYHVRHLGRAFEFLGDWPLRTASSSRASDGEVLIRPAAAAVRVVIRLHFAHRRAHPCKSVRGDRLPRAVSTVPVIARALIFSLCAHRNSLFFIFQPQQPSCSKVACLASSWWVPQPITVPA